MTEYLDRRKKKKKKKQNLMKFLGKKAQGDIRHIML